MAIVLFAFGILILVSSARGKASELNTLLKTDGHDFVVYAIVIIAVGSLGYFKQIRPVANMFLALVFVALFIGSGSKFFEQFSTTFGAKK